MGKSDLFLSSAQIRVDQELCNAIRRNDSKGAVDAINKGASLNARIYAKYLDDFMSISSVGYASMFCKGVSRYLLGKEMELNAKLQGALLAENLQDVRGALLAGANVFTTINAKDADDNHQYKKNKHEAKNLLMWAKANCKPEFYEKFIHEAMYVLLIYRDELKVSQLITADGFKTSIKFSEDAYDLVDMLHIMKFPKKNLTFFTDLMLYSHYKSTYDPAATALADPKAYATSLLPEVVSLNNLDQFIFALKHGADIPTKITINNGVADPMDDFSQTVHQILYDIFLYRGVMSGNLSQVKSALYLQAKIDSRLFGEPIIMIASSYAPEFLDLLKASLTVQAFNTNQSFAIKNAFDLGATTIFYCDGNKTILEVPQIQYKSIEIQFFLRQQMLLEASMQDKDSWVWKAVTYGANIEHIYQSLDNLSIFNYLLYNERCSIKMLKSFLSSKVSFLPEYMENYLTKKLMQALSNDDMTLFETIKDLNYSQVTALVKKSFGNLLKFAIEENNVEYVKLIIAQKFVLDASDIDTISKNLFLYEHALANDCKAEILALLKPFIKSYTSDLVKNSQQEGLKAILDTNDVSKVDIFVKNCCDLNSLRVDGKTVFGYLLHHLKPLEVGLELVKNGLALTSADEELLVNHKFLLETTQFDLQGHNEMIIVIDETLFYSQFRESAPVLYFGGATDEIFFG